MANGNGGGTSFAAPSESTDAETLNVFLVLERVQEDFYRDALRKGRLSGELEQLATTIGSQESEHVALLADRLGSRSTPRLDFRDSSRTPVRFRDNAGRRRRLLAVDQRASRVTPCSLLVRSGCGHRPRQRHRSAPAAIDGASQASTPFARGQQLGGGAPVSRVSAWLGALLEGEGRVR
jgi:hypothetical protein